MGDVTIGMPVFNDIQFIEQSLKSILGQSYTEFTLIISDDGSTDGSQEICERFTKEDKRVNYIRQPKNLGISQNMKFLLSQAKTDYFMWAADDDLWHEDFVGNLLDLLKSNSECVSAFCDYNAIDEQGDKYEDTRSFNYKGASSYTRLKAFIKNSDDGFGYGVFRTKDIKDVEFPVWWWPNKKSAYNNIYPTLCYYLAKGDYSHFKGEPLFYKREKTNENTHHEISGEGNAFKETLSYIIRRFNLVMFSSKLIYRGSSFGVVVRSFGNLFYYWFVKSSLVQLKLAGSSFWKNRVLRKNKGK